MKIIFSNFFPRRLFFWSLIFQAGCVVGSYIVFGYLSWFALASAEMSHWRLFLTALGIGLVITLLVNAVLLRRLLVPLGRLIEKTRRLREFPFDVESAQMDLGEDDPGEWFELDRALNLLGQSLREKTIELSREKTELRAIMSSISEAVLAVSNGHQVLFYNSQLASLFHIKSGAVDQKISGILRHPSILDAYDEVLRGHDGKRVEISIPVPESEEQRQYLLSISALKKKHNQEIYGAVGLFYDITQLKAAERMRIEFVGNVSHELRTPLTSISGYLQTVIQDFNQERYSEAKEFLGIIEKNVNRLKSLVADLLDLSNLESGKELEKDWVPTEVVTETVLRQFREHRKDYDIVTKYDAENIYGDHERLAQVLRNLLENAFRYVPKGKRIEIQWVALDSKYTQLKVIDNGPGIAPEHQSRLFERFYRVDQSRARMDGGTGIGLSLVKHIVQRHGGRIELTSQLEKGAQFVCTFPNF